MHTKTLYTFTIGLAGLTASFAQPLTGFGTGDFEIDSSTFTTNTQGADDYYVSGPDNFSTVFAYLNTPVSIGLSYASLQLNLTGTLAAQPNSTAAIELFDADFNSVKYSANWSGFTQGVSSSILLTYVPAVSSFNGTVESIQVSSGGTGSTLSFTFENLSAQPIPEPAAYMAFAGLGVLGYTLIHRRRSAARAARTTA